MWSIISTALSAALLLSLLGAAEPASEERPTYKVHHRFLPHPSPQTPPPFREIANLDIYNQVDGSQKFDSRLSGVSSNDEIVDDGKGFYQLAISTEGSEGQEGWVIGSTRSCYLSSSPPKVIINLSPSSVPNSVSIYPSSTSSQNACSLNSSTSVKLPSSYAELKFEFVKSSEKIYAPSLAPPPTVDPTTGTPAPPEVEKTFFQKYWMYIVGIALFFAVQMGPDDPKQRAGGAAAK